MLKACGEYIIVRPIYEEKKGVIFIPDTVKKTESEFYGVVLSVGPDYPYEVKPGDKVLFRRHEGTEIESSGRKLLALKKEWVNAVIE